MALRTPMDSHLLSAVCHAQQSTISILPLFNPQEVCRVGTPTYLTRFPWVEKWNQGYLLENGRKAKILTRDHPVLQESDTLLLLGRWQHSL